MAKVSHGLTGPFQAKREHPLLLRTFTWKPTPKSHVKRGLNFIVFGNEVYYAACSLLLILKNLCSKLHGQKVSSQFPFHIKSGL